MAPRRKYEEDGWNAGYDDGYPTPEEAPDWWINDDDDWKDWDEDEED